MRAGATFFQQGSVRQRIHELLEIDGGWMTHQMVAAEFDTRWPDTREQTIRRAFYRLTNTEWVETRHVEGTVQTGWDYVPIVSELRTL